MAAHETTWMITFIKTPNEWELTGGRQLLSWEGFYTCSSRHLQRTGLGTLEVQTGRALLIRRRLYIPGEMLKHVAPCTCHSHSCLCKEESFYSWAVSPNTNKKASSSAECVLLPRFLYQGGATAINTHGQAFIFQRFQWDKPGSGDIARQREWFCSHRKHSYFKSYSSSQEKPHVTGREDGCEMALERYTVRGFLSCRVWVN